MRDRALDATRSASHFGIVAANMPFFALPGGYGLSWWITDAGSADLAATFLIRAFCEGRFIGVFTLLYGFGIAQQLASKGNAFVLRRLLIMALVGLAHGVFFFAGDILLAYAITGAVYVFWLSRVRNKLTLVALGLALSVIGMVSLSAVALLAQIPRINGDVLLDIVTQGTLLDAVLLNFEGWVGFYAEFPLHQFFYVLGCFALGAWMYESFASLDQALKQIDPWRAVLWTVGIGGSAVYSLLMLVGQKTGNPTVEFLAAPLRPLFGFVFMLALLQGGYRLFQRYDETPLVRLFARTGRASLSLYLGQTALGLLLFQGFGLYGTLSMAEVLVVSLICVVVLQILLFLWLSVFEKGPLEALLSMGRRASEISKTAAE